VNGTFYECIKISYPIEPIIAYSRMKRNQYVQPAHEASLETALFPSRSFETVSQLAVCPSQMGMITVRLSVPLKECGLGASAGSA
jgi:hypothetical protein